MIQNVASGLVKALLAASTEQRMQQNVIGFKRGVGLELTAPVAFFVLLGEKILTCRIDRSGNPAGQVIDLSEPHLRHGNRTLGQTLG